MALRSGRLLEDVDAGRGLAVISTRAAERLWPQQNPIGKRFRYGPDDSPWVEVIGVVSDVRTIALTEDPPLHVYRPAADYFYGRASLAVKTSSDPAAVAPVIQQIMRELDPELPVPTPRTMEDIVAASVAQRRFQMNLMLLLAAAAAFLAGLGIYAVVSQSVAQRTGEFGIRMALGAAPGNILGLVLRHALRPVLVGLGAGIVMSLGLDQFLRSLLFRVSPTDLVPFVSTGGFLVAIALLASLLPAWRAARVDPMMALRHE